MNRRAFTIIELLVVIAILSLLAAILLPVFLSVRAKSRQAVCTSNLHQIGLAVALYAQDFNGDAPLGGDLIDVNTNVWQTYDSGDYWTLAQNIRPLQEVLNPYTHSKDIWHCPADNGFDEPDYNSGVDISAHPSAFDQYGNSYDYRTEIAFRQVNLSGLVAYDEDPPYAEHGASEINLLCDLSGSWHSSRGSEEHFNVLMCDGHIKMLTKDALDDTFGMTLDKPTP